MHENFSSHFTSIAMNNAEKILVGMLSMQVVWNYEFKLKMELLKAGR
jgi:hypothetical protein